MEITIDINDYLDHENIAKIVEEEFRMALRRQIHEESDIARIISNISYSYILRLVSEEWNIDAAQELKETTHRVLTDDSAIKYEMFASASFGRPEGPAVKPFREICEESRPLIREMVEKHIREYPFDEFDRGLLSDTIGEAIVDVLLDVKAGREQWNEQE